MKWRTKYAQFENKKALDFSKACYYYAVWTGLELFMKTPYIKGLSRGRFLGAPRCSPFNISLTVEPRSKCQFKANYILNFELLLSST